MPVKSAPRDKNKKLTDFFAHRPSASAVSSTPTETTIYATRRPATRASTAAVDREFSMKYGARVQVGNTSTTTTRKRPRSPDSNNPDISLHSPRPKSPRNSAKALQSDAHSKRPKAVVYVTSPFSSQSALVRTPVRAHNNTLAPSSSDSSKQVVCSSQSDEAELVLPISESRDLGEVVEGIHSWRQKALFSHSSSPRATEDAMEVDTPLSSPIRGSSASPQFDAPIRTTATPRGGAASQTPMSASACLPSPPDMIEFLPFPPTPEPMDPDAKTAKLIAEIKARAFATNQSSDDEQPLTFRELEDSDDGDLIDDLPLISNTKVQSSRFSARRPTSDIFSSPLSSVPSTFNDATIGRCSCRTPDCLSPPLRPTRISARTRRPAASFRIPVTIAESSTSRSRSLPLHHKRPQVMNPLHALLREKELEDKRGTSCAALRLAEEAIKQSSRETSIDSDDEFGCTNQPHFADEQAAWKAVHESRKLSSPAGSSGMEDFAVGDCESRMLGVVAGDNINKILAGDKDSKGKGKACDTDQKMALGVPLWIQSSGEDTDVDSMSSLSLSGHPILTCLDGFIRSGDDSLLNLILRNGALAGVPRDILLSNIPQLLDMALFASSQIADAVYIALRDLWGSNPHIQMPFTAILFVLVRLGASPSILEVLGLDSRRTEKRHVTHESLLEAVKRLLAVLKAASCSAAFSSDDVPNVVLILVIMGLDPLTSSELHIQLNTTVDAICNHGATDCLVYDIYEKVLGFAKKLTPINQARLVSFFASGSGRTRYIARRLAYRVLVSVPDTLNHQGTPLEPLILLLSPDIGSGEPFDVTDESTDYEELRHRIDILSVALMDIAPYVEEECALMKSASSASVQGSPNKPKKPPVAPLELLRRVLEVLQSKIVDTRAAHLDRSRAKAAIQRLTMRICYDRMALIGGRPRRRASTLKAYFSQRH